MARDPQLARDGADFNGPEVMYSPVADGAPARAMVAMPSYPPPAPVFGGFAPRGPEILYGGFNQTWLAHCLRRRWLMAIFMGMLVGAAAAALLNWVFPNVSQVTAYLKVKSQTDGGVFDEHASRLPFQEIERQAMNHLALLKSPFVLEGALQEPGIVDLDAVKRQRGEELLWLMEELKVSFPGDGEILEVRYEGEEDAEQMEKVVAAVVKAYQDKVLLQDRLQAAATQADLRTVLEATKNQIQEDLTDLETKSEGLGTLREDVEIPQLSKQISQLEEFIAKSEKELVDIEVMKELAIMSSKSPAALDQAIAEEMERDPTMRMYKEQIFSLQQQLQQQRSATRNPGGAQIKRLEASIAQSEADARQYEAQTAKAMRDRFAKMPNEALRAAIAEYTIRHKSATETLRQYRTDLEEARTKLENLGAENPEIAMLEQNIENQTEIAKSLEQQVLQWQVINDARDRQERAGQVSDLDKVTIIQPATGLADVNTVERWTIIGIGGAAAMALACYGIALLEFRHRRLNGPTDVDEGLGIRVLGVLPPASLKTMAGNSIVAAQVAEAIDNVRATLMHDSTSAPRQVVMITSSGSQEGTTVVASSLALSLSRAGRRTLLVDGDLRAPSIHKLFGMALEDGLSEVLRSEIDLADAVRPTNNEGLYLLTAGICSSEAIHALATDQPQAIFEKLRDQFDFVVIDAPPVLGISDALSLGQYTDGAILTVLRDHSEIHKIHKAVELLKGMGIRVIGAVVNGVPIKADRRVVRLHQAMAHPTPRLPAKVEA